MISVSNVTKHFDKVHALAEVNLDIAAGEFITIVGPSGCGKSTLLRIIAGLVSTNGSVMKPAKGAFVFQDAALLPWRNVQKNVELLMELESVPKAQIAEKARSVLQQVGLTGFEKSYPHQLSGGMKMRLSLARSLVLRPDYLLMDEPLSAVDELTREVLQEEIHTLWNKDKFTAILVTHNVAEAVYLSNRVVVMSPRPGEIIHIVDVPFGDDRNQKLRSTSKFTKLVSDISGKLRTWK
jgi:NitT/TauT family transport system ATP-binding protein|tara:strand:+ start:225 stop:938 length:714 start_codon:yes stop_codon:yes gene_type:complete